MTQKKPVLKSPVAQEKEQYKAFLKRLKLACDIMMEPGFFEQLPKDHLLQLFRQQLPPLKLAFASGTLTKEQERAWQNQFKLRLTDLSLKTPTGHIVPIADYFREGVLLAKAFKKANNIFLRYDLFQKGTNFPGLVVLFFLIAGH